MVAPAIPKHARLRFATPRLHHAAITCSRSGAVSQRPLVGPPRHLLRPSPALLPPAPPPHAAALAPPLAPIPAPAPARRHQPRDAARPRPPTREPQAPCAISPAPARHSTASPARLHLHPHALLPDTTRLEVRRGFIE
ncbi:hypothetical protein BS78_09G068500 [Paspalum vaginatum]|nr:hypothetical protein BS78_09G068500 [Paspalum vaginatum]